MGEINRATRKGLAGWSGGAEYGESDLAMSEEEKRKSFLSNFLICCAAIIWSRALYLTYTVVVKKGSFATPPPRIVSLSFPVT